MKGIRLVALGVVFLVPVLTGCGSSSPPPPFTVSCHTHPLAGGFVRANIAVSNDTQVRGSAIIYGAPFLLLRHMYPVLSVTEVVINGPNGRQTFEGLTVPGVPAHKRAHVILRFARPAQAHPVLATDRHIVHTSDASIFQNPNCVIP